MPKLERYVPPPRTSPLPLKTKMAGTAPVGAPHGRDDDASRRTDRAPEGGVNSKHKPIAVPERPSQIRPRASAEKKKRSQQQITDRQHNERILAGSSYQSPEDRALMVCCHLRLLLQPGFVWS